MGQSATAAPATGPQVVRRRKSSGRMRKKYPLMCTVPPPTQHEIQPSPLRWGGPPAAITLGSSLGLGRKKGRRQTVSSS
jgi:hypothetical protein